MEIIPNSGIEVIRMDFPRFFWKILITHVWIFSLLNDRVIFLINLFSNPFSSSPNSKKIERTFKLAVCTFHFIPYLF